MHHFENMIFYMPIPYSPIVCFYQPGFCFKLELSNNSCVGIGHK